MGSNPTASAKTEGRKKLDWFTSDTHFGHANIIPYCGRPFRDVTEMNGALIHNWNVRVRASDRVIHLGDFALGPKDLWRGYRQALNGRILFVVGNHDAPRARWIQEVLLPGDEWCEQFVYTTADGTAIHLAHVPPGYDDGREMPTEITHDDSTGTRFCGHVHDAWSVHPSNDCINIGVDVRGFEPRTWQELVFTQ